MNKKSDKGVMQAYLDDIQKLRVGVTVRLQRGKAHG
jgi:hypothetical protein